MRTKLLKLRALPKEAAWTQLKLPPILAAPTADTDDPMRTKERQLTVDPMCAKFNTLTALPKRAR